MKAKRQNMFWKVAGSSYCLLHEPGLGERLWVSEVVWAAVGRRSGVVVALPGH